MINFNTDERTFFILYHAVERIIYHYHSCVIVVYNHLGIPKFQYEEIRFAMVACVRIFPENWWKRPEKIEAGYHTLLVSCFAWINQLALAKKLRMTLVCLTNPVLIVTQQGFPKYNLCFKVDMKWKVLFSCMKVHGKHEWTPLTLFWYLIWFQRYQRLKNRNTTLKIGSLQTTTTTIKIVTS